MALDRYHLWDVSEEISADRSAASRWPQLAGAAALLMVAIWIGDLFQVLTAPASPAAEMQVPSTAQKDQQAASTPRPPAATPIETVEGKVQLVKISQKGLVRITLEKSGGGLVTLVAMPSLGVIDPMPSEGDTILARGLSGTYQNEPQLRLEHRKAIRVIRPAPTVNTSTALQSNGSVLVKGRITSYREYQAKNGKMLLFTLDDHLSGVMFAPEWSKANQPEILALAAALAEVKVQGTMGIYQGQPSLEAAKISALP